MAVLAPESTPPGIPYAPLIRRWAAPAVEVWTLRDIIAARSIFFHTNGASGPGSLQAARNWAESDADHTKSHYQVQRDGTAVKFLPSNRKGIASYKADPWALSVENQDLGWPSPGPIPWSAQQLETNAQILAHEYLLSGGRIRLQLLTAWDGAGFASHTDPFSYPYTTKYEGKPCPGDGVKWQVRNTLLPRTLQILNGVSQIPADTPPLPAPQETFMAGSYVQGDGTKTDPPSQVFPYPGNGGAVWELMDTGALRHVEGSEAQIRAKVATDGGPKFPVVKVSQAWIDAHPYKLTSRDAWDEDSDVRQLVTNALGAVSRSEANISKQIADFQTVLTELFTHASGVVLPEGTVINVPGGLVVGG